MQLEHVHEQWQQLGRKLDQSLALGHELMRHVVMQPARRRINRMALWPAIDIGFSAFTLMVCGWFFSGHAHDWKLVMPATIVMLCTLGLLISSIHQLNQISLLDWSGPVADIQVSLERLKLIKIQQFKWVILLGPLVWICGCLIGLHWLFEWLTVDRVKVLDKLEPWIVANYLFGLLFIPLGYLAAQFLTRKCHHHLWWHSVMDGIAGNSIKTVRHDIQRWSTMKLPSP